MLSTHNPDFAFWYEVVAWGSLASFLLIFFGGLALLKYYTFDEDQRRHYRAIKEELIDAKPTSLAIHTTEVVADYRDETYGLLEGRDPGQQTIRDSLGELRGAIADQTPTVPLLALRGAYEGLLLLVFGGIVLLPASWWESAASMDATAPSLDPVFAAGGLVGDVLAAAIGAFPLSDVLVALVMLTVLSVGGFIYQHGILAGILLIAGAIVLSLLDHYTAEDLSVRLYPDHRYSARVWVAVLGIVWLLGVVPVALFSAFGTVLDAVWMTGSIDFAMVGGFVGVLLAGGYAAYCGWFYGTDAFNRLVARQAQPDDDTYLVATYLLVRKLFAIVALVALPLVALYAFESLSSGKAVTVAGVLVTADAQVQLSLLGAGVVVALVVKRQYPTLFEDLRLAVYRALSSRAVRAWVFARGMPFISVGLGTLLAWPFLGMPLAVGAGVAVGLFVRVITFLWTKTKYRFIDLQDYETPVVETVIEGFTIEDGDGEPIYVARVDGYGLAHRDKGQLVETALATAHRRLRENEYAPSFANYYYQQMSERGTVDMADVEKQLRGDVETRVEASLQAADDNRLEIGTLDEEMRDEYPESHYERAINTLRRRGDIERRQGDYVYHGGST